MEWTKAEQKEIDKYFNSDITQMTLFKRIHKINPKRTYEAITRRLRRMRANGHTRNKEEALKKLKVGYLDIESTNLNANFGLMLSWFIKERGKNKYDFSVITKKEIFEYSFDKRVVKELLEAMKKYDVLYTHYGSDRRFDIPFIRTKALQYGLERELPKYMEQFIMDTYPIARNKLRLHSNRLGSIAEAAGIKNVKKTPIETELWRMAIAGHPKSLKYIKDHNKKDVQLLERVHKKIECFERAIYRSI